MLAIPHSYGGTSRVSSTRWGIDSALSYRYVERSTAILGFLLLALLVMGCEKKEVPPEAGPPEVEVTDVVQRDVPVYQEWVAQLNGENNAEITPKVQGYLLKQDYGNGYYVKKGQLLYELDPRPFQAAEEKAKADVAIAEANFAKAQNDVIRDTPLAAQNAIPKRQLDTDIASEASWIRCSGVQRNSKPTPIGRTTSCSTSTSTVITALAWEPATRPDGPVWSRY